jgi:hypothetical protein
MPVPYSLNAAGQIGYFGPNRVIAGRHPGTVRNTPLAFATLPVIGASNDPANWFIDSGVTVTTGVRDPFGGSQAVKLSVSSGVKLISPYRGNPIGTWRERDVFMSAMWVRGRPYTAQIYTLFGRYNADNFPLVDVLGYADTVGSDEWNCVVAWGRASGPALPTGNTAIEIQIQMNAGDEIEVFQPQIYFLSQDAAGADFERVTDTELAEIATNLNTAPGYLYPNTLGTPEQYKLIGHGGLGTALSYVQGTSPGQLTIVGSFTPKKYEPIFGANNQIKGWVELINATINT